MCSASGRGLSTWLATLVAFGGVFLVLRPNFETAGWGVLLPVMSAAGMAVTIIANRKVTGRASVLAMQYYMSVTAMLFLLVATSAAHFSGLENFRDAAGRTGASSRGACSSALPPRLRSG